MFSLSLVLEIAIAKYSQSNTYGFQVKNVRFPLGNEKDDPGLVIPAQFSGTGCHGHLREKPHACNLRFNLSLSPAVISISTKSKVAIGFWGRNVATIVWRRHQERGR